MRSNAKVLVKKSKLNPFDRQKVLISVYDLDFGTFH